MTAGSKLVGVTWADLVWAAKVLGSGAAIRFPWLVDRVPQYLAAAPSVGARSDVRSAVHQSASRRGWSLTARCPFDGRSHAPLPKVGLGIDVDGRASARPVHSLEEFE